MIISFTVAVTVERSTGPFASREDLTEKVQEALENADEGVWYSDNDAMYETTDWQVTPNS